jgi:hypothetical protein
VVAEVVRVVVQVRDRQLLVDVGAYLETARGHRVLALVYLVVKIYGLAG